MPRQTVESNNGKGGFLRTENHWIWAALKKKKRRKPHPQYARRFPPNRRTPSSNHSEKKKKKMRLRETGNLSGQLLPVETRTFDTFVWDELLERSTERLPVLKIALEALRARRNVCSTAKRKPLVFLFFFSHPFCQTGTRTREVHILACVASAARSAFPYVKSLSMHAFFS